MVEIALWLWIASLRVTAVILLVQLVSCLLPADRIGAKASLWRSGVLLALCTALLPPALTALPPTPVGLDWVLGPRPLGNSEVIGSTAVPDHSDRTRLRSTSSELSTDPRSWTSPPRQIVRSTPGALPPPPGEASHRTIAAAHSAAGIRSERADRRSQGDLLAGLLAIWLLGLLSQLLRDGVGIAVLFRHVCRSERVEDPEWLRETQRACHDLGCQRSISLRWTHWRGAPALCGLLRPVILLPESLRHATATQRRSVLRHELIHWIHGDNWQSRAAAALRTVFWFHPLVGHAVLQMLRYQELRCDRAVIRSGVSPIGYAESLVEIARHLARSRTTALLAQSMSGARGLEERVRHALAGLAPARGARSGPWILVIALGAATSAWALQSSAPTRDHSEQPHTLTSRGHVDLDGDRAASNASLSLPSKLDRIKLVARNDVTVEPTDPAMPARLIVQASSASAAQIAVDQIEQGPIGDRCELTVPRLPPGCWLRLQLPGHVELDVILHRGNFTSSAPLAATVVHASHGSIVVRMPGRRAGGPIRTSTSLGVIDVDLFSIDEVLEVSTSRGDVAVTLRDPGQTGRVRASSSLGDVTVHVPASVLPRIRVAADIDNSAPRTPSGFDVMAWTSRGTVTPIALRESVTSR